MSTNISSEKRPSWPSLWGSLVLGVGFLFVYGGERVVGAGTARGVLTALGALFVLGAVGLRAFRLSKSDGDARRVEMRVLQLSILAASALALYLVQSDLASSLFGGKALAAASPKLGTVLTALWPVLLLGAVVPLLLVELSFASMAQAAHVEVGRIEDAALSGLGLVGAIVFAFSIAYVAAERDKKIDFSYFRTARPGEATRNIVRSLDQPVTISYFFPPANDVGEAVSGYLDDLKKESGKLEVARYDQAIDVGKARELGVSGNGMVVVARGARREQLSLGTEIESARTQLKNLDKEVQKRLLAIAKPGRTVYLTAGHGERLSDPLNDTDKRFTIRALRQLLLDQSYSLKDLGAGEGLATDVPADAAVVMVVGPTKPFLPEESAAVARYVERGGRLFIALDPDGGVDHKQLLASLGLTYLPTTLANDAVYARRTHQDGDRINIVSQSFSSHPSVSTLSRLHAPLILIGSGALEESKEKPKGVVIDFIAHGHPATWNDKNGNFAFDSGDGEIKKGWELAAAVTRRKEGAAAGAKDGESRSLVLADSDAISDGPVNSVVGNAYLVLDGMRWLLGDEALAGETTSEADVAIVHTRNQDKVWFYSTIFLAPALVLGVGFFATRRTRPRPRAGAGGGSAKAGGAGEKEAA